MLRKMLKTEERAEIMKVRAIWRSKWPSKYSVCFVEKLWALSGFAKFKFVAGIADADNQQVSIERWVGIVKNNYEMDKK